MPNEQIRDFIVEWLGWTGSRDELTDDYPLITNHVIDSLGIYRLVNYLETEFGIEVDDEELVAENFGTIGTIGRLVAVKRDGS